MTGTIITQYYGKSEFGTNMRFFSGGSFFFIEPDIAITAYVNLADTRSNPGNLYGEDYLYFDSDIKHFNSETLNKDGIQCIRVERQWLKEFPKKNITEIHFPHPVSQEFFTISKKKPGKGQHIICEGYAYSDDLNVEMDPAEMNFFLISKREAKKIKFFRQGAFIEEIHQDDCIYTDLLEIEKIDVMYTTCFPSESMIGGPILDYYNNEVIGILSHETDDPYKSQQGLMGVRL